jgi:murein DD-endopeptidase MepM/ murein hydrolase activator NlpD
MAKPRINLMIMREGEIDQAVRSYSLPAYLPRLAIIIGAILVLLVTVSCLSIIYFWQAALEVNDLRAQNESLRRSVSRLTRLEDELEQHRRFTRRVADLAGIDIPYFRDSVATRDSDSGGMSDDADSLPPPAPVSLDVVSRGAGILVVDCPPDPNNRPRGLPVQGRASRGFQPDAANPALRHRGIDIAAREGSPVYAPAAGVVVFAGHDDLFGLMLIVDHGGGFKTIYGHNSELKGRIGDKVVRAEIIALSGNTGKSTAPHLHYEIQRNNRPVDPAGFLGR